MIPSPEIDKLLKDLAIEYKEDDGFKYTDSFTKSGFIQNEIESTIEIYQDRLEIKVVDLLLNLSWFSADRFVYSILHKKDKALAKEELGRAIAYAYWVTYYGASACKCFQGRIEIPMKRMSLLFAMNLLSDNDERINTMGDILIRSLNAKNCIINRGDEEAIRSWFLVDLYSLSTGKEINKNIARYPEDYAPYDDALEIWDSDDLALINEKVSFLCDMHLALALFDVLPDNENERKTEYEIPTFQIFPYEILGWLAIRQRHGLKNPKKYTHPLMKTPLVKMLLKQKISFAEPKNLPYVSELLTKLKEACPDI